MKKQSYTIRINRELLERLRNIVYWTPGTSMNSLFEKALELFMKDKDFPEREQKLKVGRKIKI